MKENNKMIAEFMGIVYPKLDNVIVIDNVVIKEDDLQYHKSWDWLMPVVEKIESLSIVSFEKNLQEEGDYQCLFTKGNDILICHYADTSVEATYKAVVEFINQYNKNK